jgi:Phosphotransferase enzyme family
VFERVDYPHESPATEGLARLRGDGWSAFVKVVRSFRHWPRWATLPQEARDVMGDATAWRREVDLYTSHPGAVLPTGMRLPGLHGVVDVGEDRMLLVLEDVDVDPAPWDRQRYARAARLLGQLHVRMTAADDLPRRSTERPAELVNAMYTSRLITVGLPALAADATWRHPLLAGETKLRTELAELARRLPDLVEVAARLPQLQGHGDASPHNLLVPKHQPDTFVVIDWAMASLAAAGDDLGQLLIGHAHDGVLTVDDLPALHELLVQAYREGLADEDCRLDEAAVRAGMDSGLSVRSAFTALPLERLDEPITDDLRSVFTGRIELTRYLVDVGLRIDTGHLLDSLAA